jgi:hypothetical protein
MIRNTGMGLGLGHKLLSKVLGGGFLPDNLANGLLFGSLFENRSREEWTGDQQYKNAIATYPPKTWSQGLSLDPVNTDYVQTPYSLDGCTSYEILMYFDDLQDASQAIFGQLQSFNDGFEMIMSGSGFGSILMEHNGTQVNLDTQTFQGQPVWIHVYWDGSDLTLSAYDTQDGSLLGSETTPVTGTFDTGGKTLQIGRRLSAVLGTVAKTYKDFYLRTNDSEAVLTGIIDGTIEDAVEYANADDNCRVYYPLADYDIVNGVVTAGKFTYDYSGNDNHGEIFGTTATPVYTVNCGYIVSEDNYNDYFDFDGVDDTLSSISGLTTGESNNAYLEIELVLESSPAAISRFCGQSTTNYAGQFTGGLGQVAFYTSTGNDLIWNAGATYFDDNIHTIRYDIVDGVMTCSIDGIDLGTPLGGPNSDMYLWDLTRIGFITFYSKPIYKIDYNGTVVYVNRTIEDSPYTATVGGTPEYVRIFNVGSNIDLFGGALREFTSTTADDAIGYTSGGLTAISANGDEALGRASKFWDDGEPFTIGAWVETSLVSQKIFGGTGNHGLVLRSGAGIARLEASNVFYNFTVPAIELGTPTFVSLRKNSSNQLTLNVNGVDLETIAGPAAIYQALSNSFGGLFGNTTFNGTISDAFIYDTDLTEAQLLELYNNPNQFVKLHRANGAWGAWNCNQRYGVSGHALHDITGNGNNLILTGSTISFVPNLYYGSQTATHGWTIYDHFTDNAGTVPYVEGDSYLSELESDQAWTITGRAFWDGETSTHKLIMENINGASSEYLTIGMRGNLFTVCHYDDGSYTNLIGRYVTLAGNDNRWFNFEITNDGSQTSGGYGITITFDDETTLNDTNDIANELRHSADGFRLSGTFDGREWQGFIAYVQVNNSLRWEQGTNWQDSIGSNNGTITNKSSIDYQILLPAIEDKGTVDINGITTGRPWKEGGINGDGAFNLGTELGGVYVGNPANKNDENVNLQYPQKSILIAFDLVVADDEYAPLYHDRESGDGIQFYKERIGGTDDIVVNNEDDGVTVAASIIDNTLEKGVVAVEADSAKFKSFISDGDAVMSLQNESDITGTGQATVATNFARRPTNFGGTWENSLVYLVPLIFANPRTAEQKEKLKVINYNKLP